MVRTVDIVIVLQPFGSGKNTCFVLIQSTLRSRYFFCVMALMAQGAHRGRPVAAALCTPGLWPPKSPLRGSFDLPRQASGRAEAASVQNTALSPHPCGLPRPAGNVSAILRPPTPAVSVSIDAVVVGVARLSVAQAGETAFELVLAGGGEHRVA